MKTYMDGYKILLIESDSISREVLANVLTEHFPNVQLYYESTPDASLHLLKSSGCDIVICDAFIKSEDRRTFIKDMCSEADIHLIVVSAETDISNQLSTIPLRKDCVHHILYKPLMLKDLIQAIHCALLCIEAERKGIE